MPAPASPLDRFIRTLHRRLVVVRAAEAAGLGALAGCAMALILIPVLIWRGQPPLLPATVVVALGAVGGVLWTLSRRPTRLQAAMEADRQLRLADLLGTAVGVREGGRSDDPWQQTVLALADATSRKYEPSQVLLNRLGARAWGGIGLAAALVLTLAALPSFPTGADASSGRDRITRRPHRATPPHTPPAFAISSQRPQANRAEHSSREPLGNEAGSMTSAKPEGAGENEANEPGTADGRGRESAGDSDGVGGGAAKARQPGPENSVPPPQALRNPSLSEDGSTTGAGGATQSQSGKTKPTNSGTAANAAGPATRTPPWKSDSWPQDVRRANQVIESGALPDAYRDLVRDYFDRP